MLWGGVGRDWRMGLVIKVDNFIVVLIVVGFVMVLFFVFLYVSFLEIGGIIIMFRFLSVVKWCIVKGFVYMNVFIVGVMNIGFEKF